VFSNTPLILKGYFLYRAVTKQIQQFPKLWRYGVGEKLQSAILAVVEITTQALYARQPIREPYILKILGATQTAQLFIRLCFDEKLITEHQFFAWSDATQELSRMAAGWLSSTRNRG